MTNLGAASTIDAELDTAPDWGKQSDDLHCPLCDYNLRGLTAPRCPECAHVFSWRELLDAKYSRHPYLFEHHPERNVRSYLRTLFASMMPRRFWRRLRPSNTLVPRRLITYGIVVTLLTALIGGIVPIFVSVVIDGMNSNGFYGFGGLVSLFVSGWPGSASGKWFFDRLFGQEGWTFGFGPAVAVLLWPWLTALTLDIFRSTLRQTRIKPSHVLRCVFYSGDCGLLVAVVSGCLIYHWMHGPRYFFYGSYFYGTIFEILFHSPTIFVLTILLPILTYRLWVAYRFYLRFPSALMTVLMSQAIVTLIYLNVLWIQ